MMPCGYVCKAITCNIYYMNYYERLADMNVLYDAYRKSIKDVSWKCSVQRYMSNYLHNLRQLQLELINENYKVKPFVEFDICERGKNRHIKSPDFRDKILQRAISEYVLEPALMPHLIYRNGASIKGKGVSFTREQLRKLLWRYYKNYGNKGYVLVGDYRKFFDSIPHDKLLESIGKKINDDKFMKLFKHIITAYNPSGIGLAIGAHVSQICGVYYPTSVDECITIVNGCRYYIRHMDDFLIIHPDKEFLMDMIQIIDEESKKLNLVLNHKKTQICRIDKGFRFLKTQIRVTDSGKIVKKPFSGNIKRERNKLKILKEKYDSGELNVENAIGQYKGWCGTMKQFDCSKRLYQIDKEFNKMFGGNNYGKRI